MISSSSSWILDFGSSAHLCTSMQGFEEVRGLRKGKITHWIDNGAKIATVIVGTYPLWLLLELSLILKDYYYVPVASRNLIFIFVLV